MASSVAGPRPGQVRPPRRTGGPTTTGGTGGPPTGPAGGDLTGTYPNPTIGAGAVGNAEISDVAYSKVTGAPTTLPPSGAAGGDLAGSTYPNPMVAPGAITDAKITSLAYTKLTGAPSSLPPSGAASGDLTGTYPAPTVAKLAGAAVGVTTPLARGDLLVADATPALKRLALGAASTVLQSNGTDAVWGTSLGGPPSGTAGGDLQGTYPNPTINPTKLPWTPSGATLTPTDATKAIQWGPGTIKHRLTDATGNADWRTNLNVAGTAPDDATKSQWAAQLCGANDKFVLVRSPPGATPVYTTLLTLDATGQITLPTSGANSAVIFGPRTMKGRLISAPTFEGSYLTNNMALNPAASAWVQDDGTKPSWIAALNNGADVFLVQRYNPGGASGPSLQLDNTGSLFISGAVGQKSTGTTWANPSDRRLKDEIADYPTGLAAIVQLQPRTFVYNGKGGSTAGMRGYGFIADEMAPVMPETVSVRAGKLDPDDENETAIQTLDQSNLILALVNAVKELTARVAALEAAAPAHA